ASVLRETHREAENLHSVIDFRGFFSADGHFHDVLHIGDIDSVTRDPVAIDLDSQVSQSANFFHIYVRGSANCAENAGDGFALGLQKIEIFPKNLDADGGFDAADHFIDPHRDRLGKAGRQPGNLAH